MPLTLTRSLLVVLVPGVVAVAPWLLLAVQLSPDLKKTYADYSLPANAMLFAAVVVIGSLFEGLASIVEVRWDSQCEPEFKVREHWYAYLARTGAEPVGHRYISRMVTTLYFELAMLCATCMFFLGAAALLWLSNARHPIWLSIVLVALAAGAGVYFRWQARCTHRVICEVRQELTTRVQPVDGVGASTSARDDESD